MKQKLPHPCDKQVVTSLNEGPRLHSPGDREIGALHRGDSGLSEKEFLPCNEDISSLYIFVLRKDFDVYRQNKGHQPAD